MNHKAQAIWTPKGPMPRRLAAKLFGINRGTLIRRIWSGWPKERWFEPVRKPEYKRRQKRFICVKPYKPAEGRTIYRRGEQLSPYGMLSWKELANILCVDHETLAQRVYAYGWTFQDAINTPLYGRPGVDFVLPPEIYARKLEEARLKHIEERSKEIRNDPR
ncbi:MAG: hypothetical protein P8Y47_05760 [Alphaproteobacteria bacterium]